MKVKVRLFGTLDRYHSGYRSTQGIDLEMAEGSNVQDLLAALGIPASEKVAVTMEGSIIKADEKLKNDVSVNIVQAYKGG